MVGRRNGALKREGRRNEALKKGWKEEWSSKKELNSEAD